MKRLAKLLFVVGLAASFAARAFAADLPAEIPLWSGTAPGSEGKTEPENVRVTDAGDHVVTRVHRPTLTPFLPTADHANGTAILVIPGGGHRELWMDHEGYSAARMLAAHGYAAFVLKYRLAREPASTYRIEVEALADTRRAIRTIRGRADEWHVDPARVGAIGFSAGGELVWLASSRHDPGDKESVDPIERQPSRPSFLGFIYPGRSGDIQPTADTPPAFMACAYDDRQDIAEGLAEVYLRFKRVGAPAELHVYGSGGHGFGIRAANARPAGQWLSRFEEWLADRKLAGTK